MCAAVVTPAWAAPRRPITGRLDRPGYTVIALGYNGTAVSSTARSFSIVPRDSRVTLQLRDGHGKYAGPIVVGGSATRVVVGVRAGARLGAIAVLPKQGYAKVTRRQSAKAIDTLRTAQARRGVPLGRGRNFGLVRSRQRAAAGSGRDQDLDGVPNVFDIDVNGNMVLNALERSAAAGTKVANALGDPPPPGGQLPPASGTPGPPPLNNFSQLFLTVDQTVNADASAVTVADIDRVVAGNLSVVFLNVADNTRLDCGRLVYCSGGGTGMIEPGAVGPGFVGDPFPACCTPDARGFGLMRLTKDREFRLRPNATSAQVGSGDTFLLRQGSGENATEKPESLNFVFNTTPAVQSWRDGAGSSGTITYPAAIDALGTGRNPIAISKNAAGDYVATFTLWRPQRQGIVGAGETAGFVDIGGLEYEANVANIPRSPSAQPGAQGAGGPQCPAASLSTSDPQLTVSSSGAGGQLLDHAADQPADPTNTLTFTVNLSQCAVLRSGSLAPGDILNMDIAANAASSSRDHANQTLFVQMQ
jgi:hypothetical protein